jgi:hypothetical protein
MLLPSNSIIHTQKGLKELKDIQKSDYILTADEYDFVEDLSNSEYKDTITIYTQNGEFECLPNQLIAVLKNTCEYKWKKAKNLEINDIIMSTRTCLEGTETKLPEYSELSDSIKLDEYTAWFIGFLHTKDLYKYNKENGFFSYKFEKNNYDIAIRIKFMLYNFLDNDANIDMEIHKNHYIVSCVSKNISSYLFQCIKNTERIASYIMQAFSNIRMSFIAGIIDGNQHCIEYNDRNRKYFNIITGVNKNFIKDLQMLCYSCGFETKFSIKNNIYNLEAITNHSLKTIEDIKVLLKYQNVNSFINMPKGASCNYFPIKMISSKYSYLNRIFGLHLKKVFIDAYDEHVGQINYCPVRILGKTLDTKCSELFTISLQNNEQFYCNGYLMHV